MRIGMNSKHYWSIQYQTYVWISYEYYIANIHTIAQPNRTTYIHVFYKCKCLQMRCCQRSHVKNVTNTDLPCSGVEFTKSCTDWSHLVTMYPLQSYHASNCQSVNLRWYDRNLPKYTEIQLVANCISKTWMFGHFCASIPCPSRTHAISERCFQHF